ncbi:MAG: nucleotidyl transferase AbiEii/AbiGii toxin family protein [Candidatus Onthovivens sp.]|nr:nucleotidyl transferase AbiEii/AbiGii toxin family protein [Candidatus Onthovivens sp.]
MIVNDMNNVIEQLIQNYNPRNSEEVKNAIREITQSIVLIGLSRSNFFSKASFYGGTALRIFYGLNRYSEDLDFTLNAVDESFSLAPYIQSIINVAKSYGIDLNVDVKSKKIEIPKENASTKLNTFQTFISFNIDEGLTSRLHKDELIKAKFEVDCNPPLGFNVESKWITEPELASINVLDIESLFAGKLHAILCRNYKNTVKGRDFYDFIFYINKKIKSNLNYLKNKLIESNILDKDAVFTIDILKEMLVQRFNQIDFKQVREDAQKFVMKNEDLSLYCKELFIDCVNKM